jgi:hypothetical protein
MREEGEGRKGREVGNRTGRYLRITGIPRNLIIRRRTVILFPLLRCLMEKGREGGWEYEREGEEEQNYFHTCTV